MKIVVISAVNIFASGMLTIARSFLWNLRSSPLYRSGHFQIILFCHSKELYADLADGRIQFIEKPLSRKNWLFRLFYEYIYFYLWSITHPVDTWISLHDITPNVRAKRQIVYCHNAAPFYNGPCDLRLELWFELFRRFYKYFYRINLKKNVHVIVQQQWLREAFVRQFGCDPARVVVAQPDVPTAQEPRAQPGKTSGPATTFIYPAFPRGFKNFEMLLEAMQGLTDLPARLILTFSGSENAYARSVVECYGHLHNVDFIGFVPREKILELYADSDAMVFPSRLETWGLPLSEYRSYNKPIFVADLPYAKETLAGYDQVCPFDPCDSSVLADRLRQFVLHREFQAVRFDVTHQPPYAQNWQELLQIIALA